MRHLPAAVAMLLAALVPSGWAAADAAHPVVVELFTSQGCSSCPPADAVLLDLSRNRADVLPLAFHVTYWNSLGWRDPFSLDAATARQRGYARTLGRDGVYTPQMVVNGRIDAIGSDRAAVLDAIDRAAAGPAPLSLSVTRTGGLVRVEGTGTPGGASVWLVGFDAQRRTAVGRGENSGRTLLEANIVRSLQDLGPWRDGPLDLRRPIPDGERVAVLVQAADGRIVGAAREAGATLR